MKQDEIIKLAMEYGFTGGFDAQGNLTYDATFVEAVTEAVSYEREACAKELEAYSVKHRELTAKNPRDVDYAIMYTLDVHAHLLRDDFFEKHKEKYGSRGEA